MTTTQHTMQTLAELLMRPGEYEQRQALDALIRDNVDGLALLICMFDANPMPSLRRWIAEGLCAFRTDEAAYRIRDSLADKHMSVRLHTVIGIRRQWRYEFVPELIDLVFDSSGAVRLKVLQTLVAMEPNQATLYLLQAMHDDKAYIRSYAEKILKRDQSGR